MCVRGLLKGRVGLHVHEHIHVCTTGGMVYVCVCVFVQLWTYKERCVFVFLCTCVSFCLHMCISNWTCLCVVLSGMGFCVCVREGKEEKREINKSRYTNERKGNRFWLVE